MKAVKRSIILCALSLALCVALLVGSTFAWFSDSITNSGNTISAGSLQAQCQGEPNAPVSFVDGENYEVESVVQSNGETWYTVVPKA